LVWCGRAPYFAAHAVRKIHRIRRALARGGYDVERRLDATVERLLLEIRTGGWGESIHTPARDPFDVTPLSS
jgi:hypothetical protein